MLFERLTTDNTNAEKDIHHLHAVAPPAAVDEAVCVVGAWKFLALGYWDLEEVTERLPSLTHLVLKQVLLWHK